MKLTVILFTIVLGFVTGRTPGTFNVWQKPVAMVENSFKTGTERGITGSLSSISGGGELCVDAAHFSNSHASAQLQALLDDPFIHSIYINNTSQYAEILLQAYINAHGKLVRLANNVRFTGKAVIDSMFIAVTAHQFAFDTSVSIVHSKTVSGYLTPANFGALQDGSNAVTFLNKAINTAADNRLEVNTAGKYFVDGSVILKPKTKINGGNFTLTSGSSFTTELKKCDSVYIDGITVKMTGEKGSTKNVFDIRTRTDTSYGLVMKNVRIEQARVNYYGVRLTKQKNAVLDNFYINESGSSSILFDSCINVTVQNCTILNSGRGGISAHRDNNGFKFINNVVIGCGQNEDLPDGGLDVYGERSRNGVIMNNYVDVGTTRINPAKRLHIAIRIKGSDNILVSNNIAISQSPYLMTLVNVSNRNQTLSSNVKIRNNYLHITGGNLTQVVSWLGTKDYDFEDNFIKVDSNVTISKNARVFLMSYMSPADTVAFANIRNNNIQLPGIGMFAASVYACIKKLDMSGCVIDGTTESFASFTNGKIENLIWDGGLVDAQVEKPYFDISKGYKTALFNNISMVKATSPYIAKTQDDSIILIENIETKGQAAKAVVSSSPAYTVQPAASNIRAQYNGKLQQIKLPGGQSYSNAGVVVSNAMTSPQALTFVTNTISGTDTVYQGGTAFYYNRKGKWQRVGFSQGGRIQKGFFLVSTIKGYDTLGLLNFDKPGDAAKLTKTPSANTDIEVLAKFSAANNTAGFKATQKTAYKNKILFVDEAGVNSFSVKVLQPGFEGDMPVSSSGNSVKATGVGAGNTQTAFDMFAALIPFTPAEGQLWRDVRGLKFRFRGIDYNLIAAE